MSKSGITYVENCPLDGFTGEAWNPIIGCTHSGMAGCDHCWARGLHEQRRRALLAEAPMPAQYRATFETLQVLEARFDEPVHWKRPRLVMVCPQSDLFHESLDTAVIDRVLSVIVHHPQHRFFVLTKRTANARAALERFPYDIPNLGVLASVACQADADALLPDLLATRWIGWRGVSYEPAVGPVDFERITIPRVYGSFLFNAILGYGTDHHGGPFKTVLDGNVLDLVIAGCESGHHRRPAHVAWFRAVRDQCKSAGVPFYLKQMAIGGAVCTLPLLDGVRWAQWPGQE